MVKCVFESPDDWPESSQEVHLDHFVESRRRIPVATTPRRTGSYLKLAFKYSHPQEDILELCQQLVVQLPSTKFSHIILLETPIWLFARQELKRSQRRISGTVLRATSNFWSGMLGLSLWASQAVAGRQFHSDVLFEALSHCQCFLVNF